MKWRSPITTLQVWSGTCATLEETLPKEVRQLRNSSTICISSWTFSLEKAAMMMLEERTMMAMAAETMPRHRVHLCVMKRSGEWQVWELVELVPPSSHSELPFDRAPSGSGSREKRVRDPEHRPVSSVVEVDCNGTVTQAWPPCILTEDDT